MTISANMILINNLGQPTPEFFAILQKLVAIPPLPQEAGEYSLHSNGGVLSWVLVTP